MSPGYSRGGPLDTDRPTAENPGEKFTSNDTPAVRQSPADDLAGRVVRGCFVLVVEPTPGRYRRRTYLSLAAAERAAGKAEEAGHLAQVVLCRLEPVAGWQR